MALRTREELKSFFKAHLIPTEENFSDLIDSAVNSQDDLLLRPVGSPPTFHLGGVPSGREKILNFQRSTDEVPVWTLELNPGYQEGGATTGKGLSITNGLDQTRLFVSESDKGRVGIGTEAPQSQLHIRSSSPSGVVGYSNLKDHLTLELGQSANGGVGSIKVHGVKANQFGLLKGGDDTLHLDVSGGKYVFNADPGVSSTTPGQIQVQNGKGAVTVQLHAQGDSYFNGGKVGIGTNQPQETLHLGGNIRGAGSGGRLKIQTATGYTEIGSAHDGWSHYMTDRAGHYFNTEVHVDSGKIGSYYDDHLSLRTGPNTRIFANKDSGNVGVGTTSPQALFHVAGVAHFQTDTNGKPLSIGRGAGVTNELMKVGVTDGETIFNYVNDEAVGAIRFRVQNTDTERANNKGKDANTNDILRLYGSKSGGWVGINIKPSAPLTIAGSGKYNSPNAYMHLTPDVILFGGRNNGYETNSAQISAGLHQADTLCLVGMGKTGAERKVKVWAESGMSIQGPLSGNASGGSLRVKTSHGYTDIGPQNADWAHITTDRGKFYFNKEIHVNSGKLGTYDENLHLHTAGTTRIFANKSNGRVGIGTTSPAGLFDVNGGFFLKGKKPIIIRRYSNMGDNITYNTNYSSADYNAAIIGFVTQDVDINENKDGDFLQVRMIISNGKWHIRADIRSHNDNESWYVDVMFVSTQMSTRTGY
ncbi:MAG TPA: hypothetical protein DCR93_10785 [Cytophagales bacterium]|nr:hypothetical protein [Cytophagales bacterium]